MSLKGGDLITVGNLVLIDRLQSTGPGQFNLQTQKIYETGNYESVGVIRDTPDLSFSCESWDVAPEFEAMLTGKNFATDADGTEYKLAESKPIDVLGEFKRGKNDPAPFDLAGSAVIPYLALESMSYRFGIRDNATKTATLKGDSLFYAPGSAYAQETTGTNAANQVINFGHAPIVYNGDVVAGSRWALGVTNTVTGKRLLLGADYTETSTAVTILAAVPTSQKIRIVYQSAVVANYPQVSHAVASATRPAAIKGRYVELYVGGDTAGDRWDGDVQAVSAEYRVQLDRDEALGSNQIIAQDYDVPSTTGTIDIKARDFAGLLARLRQVADVPTNEVIGPFTVTPLPLYVKLKSPDTGDTLSTLYVSDARIQIPGYGMQVQQKLVQTLNWESDSGNLSVFKSDAP